MLTRFTFAPNDGIAMDLHPMHLLPVMAHAGTQHLTK